MIDTCFIQIDRVLLYDEREGVVDPIPLDHGLRVPGTPIHHLPQRRDADDPFHGNDQEDLALFEHKLDLPRISLKQSSQNPCLARWSHVRQADQSVVKESGYF